MVFIGIAAVDLIFTFFALCFVVGGFTQVVIPAFRGYPLFPMFRRQATLEHELARARGELQDKALEQEIQAVKEKVHGKQG